MRTLNPKGPTFLKNAQTLNKAESKLKQEGKRLKLVSVVLEEGGGGSRAARKKILSRIFKKKESL